MNNEFKNVIPGKIYQHHTGGLYEVLHLANNTETYETMVVYRSIQFGTYYTIPLIVWNTPLNSNPRFFIYNG